MAEICYLDGPRGQLAYAYTPGDGPCIVFLSGYRSDMEGTKAVYLEQWAVSQGRAFLRLDYSGHGKSGGKFENGCIGDWAADAALIIKQVVTGPLVLVGSSMGGWIACILSKRLSQTVGFVGIAAAPDFTEEEFWAGFNAVERRQVMEEGHLEMPSQFEDPYLVTRKLIEDGREQLVLRSPLNMPWPVRLLQGTADEAVARDTALKLLDHINSDDMHLTLVKDEDHRFSSPRSLVLIEKALQDILD